MTSATSNPPTRPAVLAQRYRLDRRLAQGGMAEVWLGFDLLLSRQVAVKVLKAALANDPVVNERFRREAIAVAQLNHPNIVTVYDAIEESGRQAVVMQLVNGKSLRQLLDEQKRLSPDLTMHIGCCVALALDAAHRANLVHRDVKPGNILITPDGEVLLTDFGIAKGVAPTGDDLTNDNIMMGTAKYLSPEQVRGRRLDGRADLYSLGLVLYECLAGRVPFIGQNDIDTALARLQREPTDITTLRPTLPYGLADVIHRLLARRPGDRYASGTEVRDVLTDVVAGVADPTSGGRASAPVRTDRTPTSGTPAALGPIHVGGYRGVRTPRDATPPNPGRAQARPNREFEQRGGPSLLVVGGLLLAAVIIGAVLWSTRGAHDGQRFEPSVPAITSPAATLGAMDPVDPVGAVEPGNSGPTVLAAVGPVSVSGIVTFDPDGDSSENDDRVPFAIDGDPATAWNTVCYSSKYLGGKVGVGLSLSLIASASGTLSVDIANAPWNIDMFSSTAEVAPTTMAGWGERIASDSSEVIESLTVPVTTAARHFLVLFHEVGPSPQCSNDNPYRGVISEVRFQASA